VQQTASTVIRMSAYGLLIKLYPMRRFAISDIHGCSQTFRSALRRLKLQREDILYLLGDYIDKGPNSKGVLDLIFELRAAGIQVHCLRGNHEDNLLAAYRDKTLRVYLQEWSAWPTLHSFGARELEDIPDRYWTFFDDLPHCLELEDYVLVHAGFLFAKANPVEKRQAMLNIRDWYEDIDQDWLANRLIVHGHDKRKRQRIEQQLEDIATTPVVAIDAGCVYAEHDGLGNLCVYDLDRRQVFFEPNREFINI